MPERHAQSVDEAVKDLGADLALGLSTREAEARFAEYGPNELKEEAKPSVVLLFVKQFRSRLTYVLFAAAAISFFAGERNDAYGILLAVLIDAVFGFVQERKAEDAIAKLKEMVVHEVSVLRDGEVHLIPAAQVVPGDVILLAEGDRVPADSRIVKEKDLRTQEAALTGESTTQNKQIDPLPADTPLADRKNMLWMGTGVVAGEGRAVVVTTGERTAFGGIATSLKSIEEERTPLEERMDSLGQRLGLVAILLAAFVFCIGWFEGVPVVEMFFFSVAMVVSVIPEGLPAVLAIVLAIGVNRMAKRKAIVRHVPSVETLGVTDIICTDKTGTLTENKMTVRRVFMADHEYAVTGEGWEPHGDFLLEGRKIRPAERPRLNLLLRIAAITNHATLVKREGEDEMVGDPTEGALVTVAAKAGFDKQDLATEIGVIDEIPFSSSRRYRAMLTEGTDIHGERGRHLFVVGAYDVLVDRARRTVSEGEKHELTEDFRARFDAGNRAMGDDALRVLAVAYKHVPLDKETIGDDDLDELLLLGLVGMMDPPRRGVEESVVACRKAGIRVIVATGDQVATAVAVAREIGLLHEDESVEGRAFSGAEVDGMDDEEFERVLDDVVVFARVTPDTKLRIVNALQRRGHVVAMTGDGVNDAPALKRASIGVAMGITGTEVSKEVADMVLADDDFTTIINAVEEGRVIFRNIRQTVAYLFMTNIGEVVTVLMSMLFGLPLPLLPAQILWMNLVTDGFPDVALATEPPDHAVLDVPPRRREASVITKNIVMLTVITSIAMAFGTLFLFTLYLDAYGIERARTVAFTSMACFQLWNVFNMRHSSKSIFTLGFFSNMFVFWSVVASLALQFAVLYVPSLQQVFRTVPLSLKDWLAIALVSATVTLVVEAHKFAVRQGYVPRSWF